MPESRPITIVGGGLAGLTLGIGLRQRGVPVTIWEAGKYPRHRVCGEFISGNGQAVLERLGLRDEFEKAGAVQARTVRFIAGANQSPVRELPAALCLSRFEMDCLLAEKFQALGGELREGERSNAASGEGIVRASGRQAHPTENGWRWFGLKVHARNVELAADLEMHIARNSYVGLNRINHGEINVCGLFRARPNGRAALPRRHSYGTEADDIPSVRSVGDVQAERQLCPTDLLRGEPGSLLHTRLEKADFDEDSFCSVAGLSLKPHRAETNGGIRIGDALTMIPPATGNGMSMAFESAEIATQPLADFSHGDLTWPEAQRKVAEACNAAFARRLRWARLLQTLMFSSVAQNSLGAFLMRSDLFWNFMFSRTR